MRNIITSQCRWKHLIIGNQVQVLDDPVTVNRECP